jgi:ring-1,2-phenylacetyl-CoA epoxidase subunit PaaD
MQTSITDRDIWQELETIKDPELPITVTDLGLIRKVEVVDGHIRVTMIPTYSACPAIQVIRHDICTRLQALPGVRSVHVVLSFEQPWTVNLMSDRGRQQLREHGMSVPTLRRPESVACPFCGSTDVVLENSFGPTLCRAIYYCRTCRNPIERFKAPVVDK